MTAAIAATLHRLLRPRFAAPAARPSPARRGARWHPGAPHARHADDGCITPPMLLRSECFAEDLLDA